jgi:peptidoglycan hydrolase-like protein with peptidoglycan-binding domain
VRVKRTVLSWGIVLLLAAFAAPAAGAMGRPPVAALQIGLAAKGLYGSTIDGVLGPRTRRAVVRLQRRAGIAVDGIPGPQTRRALGRLGRHPVGSRVIRRGSVGWDVSVTQFRLAWHGFPSGRLDGGFGPRTQRAARRFQRWAHIGADGLPGPRTFRALRRPLPRVGIRLRRPVHALVADGFGPRGDRFHAGVDLPTAAGVRVRSAAGGRVVVARWHSGGFGKLVVVLHRAGRTTWYAHLSRIGVRAGRRVARGASLGRVGATGAATGPHLHFEVRVRGASVNPLPALR